MGQSDTLNYEVKNQSGRKSILLVVIVAVGAIGPIGTMTSADGDGIVSYMTPGLFETLLAHLSSLQQRALFCENFRL